MPKMTISIPDEILANFKKTFPEVNVAEVARRVITEKIEELEKCGLIPKENKWQA